MSDTDFWQFVVVFAAICVGLGAALMVAIPWLWSLIKPLIHALTAA